VAVPGSEDELPFVDAHEVVVAVGREVVWAALERYVEADLLANGWPKGWFTFVLGTDPAPGFEEVERREPRRMVLEGRHRFSRYRLTFELDDGPDDAETTLRAVSHAAFPGLHGRTYRAAVISSGLHVIATQRILEAIRRRAEAGA
jgi:hypothetical protein